MMYNLSPKKERELKLILDSLSESTRRSLQNLLAMVFAEGYNKGLKAGGKMCENRRGN